MNLYRIENNPRDTHPPQHDPTKPGSTTTPDEHPDKNPGPGDWDLIQDLHRGYTLNN